MSMSQTLLFFTVLCSVLGAGTLYDMGTKKITIKKCAQCAGKENLNVVVEDVHIAPYNDGLQSIAAKFYVHQEISNHFFALGTIMKCDSSGNLGACEYIVKDYNCSNLCNLIKAEKDDVWDVLINNIDIERECPIKIGNYTLIKTVIPEVLYSAVPFNNVLLKLKLGGYDSDVEILCIDLEVSIERNNPRPNRRVYKRKGIYN